MVVSRRSTVSMAVSRRPLLPIAVSNPIGRQYVQYDVGDGSADHVHLFSTLFPDCFDRAAHTLDVFVLRNLFFSLL